MESNSSGRSASTSGKRSRKKAAKPESLTVSWIPRDSNLVTIAGDFEFYDKTEGKRPKSIVWQSMALRQFHRSRIESENSTRLGELH